MDAFPAHELDPRSRVWIYQSSRPFTGDEVKRAFRGRTVLLFRIDIPPHDRIPPVSLPDAGAETLIIIKCAGKRGAGNVIATLQWTNRLAVSCTFFGYPGAQLLDITAIREVAAEGARAGDAAGAGSDVTDALALVAYPASHEDGLVLSKIDTKVTAARAAGFFGLALWC